MAAVRAHFRPEFLNRLDEIVLFRRLQRSDMAAIVEIQLAQLRKLLADRKIALELDRGALEWLAAEGYDSTYGARPLKRVIQRSLQNPLAGLILEGGGEGGRHGARLRREAGVDDQRRAGRGGVTLGAAAGTPPRVNLLAPGRQEATEAYQLPAGGAAQAEVPTVGWRPVASQSEFRM